ncbi:MAG: hypothetical protein IKK15_00820 [Akkermansia sp.]|nr:hypothetical protein [Akkermansia sp.]
MKRLVSLICVLAMVGGAALADPVSEVAKSAREAAREYGAAVRNCDMGWALDSMYPPLRRTYADQLSSRDPRMEAANARRIMGTERESEAQAQARMKANSKALRDRYVKMGQDMRAAGFKVESFTVGNAVAEYVVNPPTSMARQVRRDTAGRTRVEDLKSDKDRSRLVVLPTKLVYSLPGGDGRTQRVQRDGYIFAVRDEVISTPGLARGTKLNKWYFIDSNTDVNILRAFFPNLPLNIELPDCGERPVR